MAKIGMCEEGILRENVWARGEWWSSVQCSILVHEYGAASAPVGAVPTDGQISKPSAHEESRLVRQRAPVAGALEF